jgi:MYXO-CTERM domain-containing protein
MSNEPIVITSHFYVSGIAGAGGCAAGGSPGWLAGLLVAGMLVRRRRCA